MLGYTLTTKTFTRTVTKRSETDHHLTKIATDLGFLGWNTSFPPLNFKALDLHQLLPN